MGNISVLQPSQFCECKGLLSGYQEWAKFMTMFSNCYLEYPLKFSKLSDEE